MEDSEADVQPPETRQPASSDPFLPSTWQEPAGGPDGPGVAGGPGTAPGRGMVARDEGAPRPERPGSSTVSVWGPLYPPVVAPGSDDATGHRSPGWRWAVVAVAAAVIGGLIGGGIVAAANRNAGSTTVKEIASGPALLNGTTDIESVIAKVLPAVVSIDATGPASASDDGSGQEDQGTGMIITSGGEVVTNNHVITGAATITVTLYGKTTPLPATLIDTDATNDVALLQITGVSNLPMVTYGNSDDVQVGDAVVAIGNALGLQAGSPTVTQGIISATGRTVQAGDSSGTTTETLSNMFQTDAAINPGNSGGPLVDSSGKVIAMNTAVASSEDGTSQAEDIGFAIPANKIGQELPRLRSRSIDDNNQSGSGYLGVEIESLTSQLRSAYDFTPTQGAVVLEVESGSPADSAGLQEGDVITSLDGKAITGAAQLSTAIQAGRPGQNVTIGLWRGQQQLSVTATLGSSGQSQASGG